MKHHTLIISIGERGAFVQSFAQITFFFAWIFRSCQWNANLCIAQGRWMIIKIFFTGNLLHMWKVEETHQETHPCSLTVLHPQAQLYRYPPCKSADLDPLWHFLLSHSSFPRWYEPGDRRPNLNHQDCGNHPGWWDAGFIAFVQSILVGNCIGQSTRIHLIGCLQVGSENMLPWAFF